MIDFTCLFLSGFARSFCLFLLWPYFFYRVFAGFFGCWLDKYYLERRFNMEGN